MSETQKSILDEFFTVSIVIDTLTMFKSHCAFRYYGYYTRSLVQDRNIDTEKLQPLVLF